MHQRQNKNVHTRRCERDKRGPQGAHREALHTIVPERAPHHWPQEQPGEEGVDEAIQL